MQRQRRPRKSAHSKRYPSFPIRKKKQAEGGLFYRSLVLQSVAAGILLVVAVAALLLPTGFSKDAKTLLQSSLGAQSDLSQVNATLENFISNNQLLSRIFDEDQGIMVFGTKDDVPAEEEDEDKDKKGDENKDANAEFKLNRQLNTDDFTQTMLLDKAAAVGAAAAIPVAIGGQEDPDPPEEPVGDTPPADASYEAPALPVSLQAPLQGAVSSVFGYREHPVSGNISFHYGVDLEVNVGTVIAASASGTVCKTGVCPTYGNYVYLDHGNGLVTFYGHCDEVLVGLGDSVTAGQKIALSGNTGVSTGPHLHYGIRLNDVFLNPLHYI